MRHDHSGSGTWNTTNTYSPGGYAAEQTWFVDADSNNTGMTPWSVNNGVLNLTAYDHDSNGKPVTSGHLDTQGTFSQQYGYFEMRAEMPTTGTVADGGQGDGVGGGAFWLLNQDGSWPPELDILEQANWGGIYTTHSGVGGHSAESSWSNIPDIGSAYHTYGVDWEADKTTWYVDGKQVFQADTPADMHSPMYMLLNLYGNDDGGSGDSTMHVDYVRAYAEGPGAATAGTGSAAVTAPADTAAPGTETGAGAPSTGDAATATPVVTAPTNEAASGTAGSGTTNSGTAADPASQTPVASHPTDSAGTTTPTHSATPAAPTETAGATQPSGTADTGSAQPANPASPAVPTDTASAGSQDGASGQSHHGWGHSGGHQDAFHFGQSLNTGSADAGSGAGDWHDLFQGATAQAGCSRASVAETGSEAVLDQGAAHWSDHYADASAAHYAGHH
ncbi:glycoside hydrolase family 16 protein [Methylobacterium nigriterrae]|uniref:glycoside hydrolase family 16 protein n=1 Tax=Methylobacterium nigriterrae TaxID=3127512 RepID=UPI003013EAFC